MSGGSRRSRAAIPVGVARVDRGERLGAQPERLDAAAVGSGDEAPVSAEEHVGHDSEAREQEQDQHPGERGRRVALLVDEGEHDAREPPRRTRWPAVRSSGLQRCSCARVYPKQASTLRSTAYAEVSGVESAEVGRFGPETVPGGKPCAREAIKRGSALERRCRSQSCFATMTFGATVAGAATVTVSSLESTPTTGDAAPAEGRQAADRAQVRAQEGQGDLPQSQQAANLPVRRWPADRHVPVLDVAHAAASRQVLLQVQAARLKRRLGHLQVADGLHQGARTAATSASTRFP